MDERSKLNISGYVHPTKTNTKRRDNNPYSLFSSKESEKIVYKCPYCSELAETISNSEGEKDCWCKNQHRWFQQGEKVRVLKVQK